MENAVDALKIAFGIIVFVIALTLAISVIGQARATSDVVFRANDKTEFYEYVTEADVNAEERIVGIETIIPTIHRYAKEQFAVTIFDNNGNLIVRYDLWAEGIMPDWNQVIKNKDKENSMEKQTYDEVNNRLARIQEVANETLNISGKEFNIEKIIASLYKVDSTTNTSVNVGAPWIGDNEKILERIKCDMLGTKYTNNSMTYQGKNLNQYKEKKFIEKFLEVTTSGETITDEEYSLETIKGNKKLEIIYIMQ